MRDAGAGMAPGAGASEPTQIPATGWWQVLRRGWREASEDQVSLLGAGVAFFGFLSLFPALAAFTLVYGLVADPATIADQAQALTASLPPEARTLLLDQLQQLASAPRQTLGWGLALAIALALWSASGGVGNL
ncbi:MAG TPA: YhjD/YihY/BrkB family envelope integrity protein, partial [Propionicimonas sp.]